MLFSRFKNREEAGKKLAQKLLEWREKSPVVLAIPRGGVAVAYEVAKTLKAPLDIIIPRKIGAPGNPELAIGAMTEDGTLILNEDLVTGLGVSEEYVKVMKEAEIEEIRRRRKAYRGDMPPESLMDKTVILVDDGIATGATVRAAIGSIRRQKPRDVVVAVPVAPPETVRALEEEVDKVVCLVVFEPFFAIGQFYEDFNQVSDEEVVWFLKDSRRRGAEESSQRRN